MKHLPPDQATRPETVLVVDDSRLQRHILVRYLRKWGFDPVEADSAEAGLAVCDSRPVDIVVSDWVMGGMNGLEFCRAFKQRDRDGYGYFILLTTKSEKSEVADGLDAGADDFLSKPVSSAEFLARIRAGQRVLGMDRALRARNDQLAEALSEIRALYRATERDLAEAREFQLSLVPQRRLRLPGAEVSLLLRPSGHVGGDLVGAFPINEGSFGFFSIDVSGHGAASALMTARLAAYLSGNEPDRNVAIARGRGGGPVPRSPAEAARRLNRLLLDQAATDQYFTMILGHADPGRGRLTFVQCGHPHPVLLRGGGPGRPCGGGGLPVGLLAAARWQDETVDIRPGDRLLCLSDGATECPVGDRFIDEEELGAIIARAAAERGTAMLDTIVAAMAETSGLADFPDDVSAVLIEF